MKNQPGAMKTHENSPGTMKTMKTHMEPWKTYLEQWNTIKAQLEPWKTTKNRPGTMKHQPGNMKSHENRPGIMKNHENRPGTMKSHETNLKQWKTILKPWKTTNTDLEPWKTNLKSWKIIKKNPPGTMKINVEPWKPWKPSHGRHGQGSQPTSFGVKNLTSLTGGHNRPPLVQKTSRHWQGGPADLRWSKKCHVTDRGDQLTSFGPKNVTSLTGGTSWPFRCLDVNFKAMHSFAPSTMAEQVNYCRELFHLCWYIYVELCFFLGFHPKTLGSMHESSVWFESENLGRTLQQEINI